MSTVTVVPKDVVITQTCVSVSISILTMEFGQSATFNVILFDSDRKPIKVDRIVLDGADYTAWASDDSYVTTFILTKYGLVSA
jgi:hypothetical protein